MCNHQQRRAAMVFAAATSLILATGCSTNSQASNPKAPAKTATSKTSPPSPKASVKGPSPEFALPKGAVVESKDQPFPELVNPNDQEWISEDGTAWVRLSNEPDRHLEEARRAFERHEWKTAAAELQRAAGQMVLEANRATPQIAEGLRDATRGLDRLASNVRASDIKSIGEFDKSIARAAHMLATHYTELARVAVKQNHQRHAGHYLKSAAKYLEKLKRSAEYFVDAEVPQAMADLGRDVTLVAGKLIEGVAYTSEEASQAVENVSAQVEKFGQNVASEGNEPKSPTRKPLKAVCVLHPIGDSGVTGTVTFLDRGGKVDIVAKLTGLKPGPHGFHIHEFGDCSSTDGTSAGDHYNPTAMPHASPDSPKRHVGDLGNIMANQAGTAECKRTDRTIQIRGANSIIGRAVIVHAGEDDLKSQPSGNAGPRVACGVIGIAKAEP